MSQSRISSQSTSSTQHHFDVNPTAYTNVNNIIHESEEIKSSLLRVKIQSMKSKIKSYSTIVVSYFSNLHTGLSTIQTDARENLRTRFQTIMAEIRKAKEDMLLKIQKRELKYKKISDEISGNSGDMTKFIEDVNVEIRKLKSKKEILQGESLKLNKEKDGLKKDNVEILKGIEGKKLALGGKEKDLRGKMNELEKYQAVYESKLRELDDQILRMQILIGNLKAEIENRNELMSQTLRKDIADLDRKIFAIQSKLHEMRTKEMLLSRENVELNEEFKKLGTLEFNPMNITPLENEIDALKKRISDLTNQKNGLDGRLEVARANITLRYKEKADIIKNTEAKKMEISVDGMKIGFFNENEGDLRKRLVDLQKEIDDLKKNKVVITQVDTSLLNQIKQVEEMLGGEKERNRKLKEERDNLLLKKYDWNRRNSWLQIEVEQGYVVQPEILTDEECLRLIYSKQEPNEKLDEFIKTRNGGVLPVRSTPFSLKRRRYSDTFPIKKIMFDG